MFQEFPDKSCAVIQCNF